LLSLIAGSADAIGFIGLGGLFTAHVTGNLVVLAAHVVAGENASVATMLSVPVFVVVLGLTRLLAVAWNESGSPRFDPCSWRSSCCSPGFSLSASKPVHALIQKQQMRSSLACSASRRWRCKTRSCRFAEGLAGHGGGERPILPA